MAPELKRLTFSITKEMEPLLASAKKEMFYDKNQSYMIRELVMAGLRATQEAAAENAPTNDATKIDFHK